MDEEFYNCPEYIYHLAGTCPGLRYLNPYVYMDALDFMCYNCPMLRVTDEGDY